MSAQAGPSAPKQAATVQAGTAEDEATVRAIVNHWQQSWENFDASVLAGDYADDADWLNAFGVRIKGGDKIVEFVSKVVKRPTVQGRHTTWGRPLCASRRGSGFPRLHDSWTQDLEWPGDAAEKYPFNVAFDKGWREMAHRQPGH
ncbi:MAG TPA: hypothetical protein VGK36_06635 [Candidatus Angelobacter sp.]